jgi:hypothetical protein
MDTQKAKGQTCRANAVMARGVHRPASHARLLVSSPDDVPETAIARLLRLCTMLANCRLRHHVGAAYLLAMLLTGVVLRSGVSFARRRVGRVCGGMVDQKPSIIDSWWRGSRTRLMNFARHSRTARPSQCLSFPNFIPCRCKEDLAAACIARCKALRRSTRSRDSTR